VAKPDKVFKQAYDWFRESVNQALSSVPPAQRAQVEQLVWQMLGVLPSPLPADPNIEDFKDTGAAADSLAVAAQIVAESLAALEYIKRAVDDLQGGNPPQRSGWSGR